MNKASVYSYQGAGRKGKRPQLTKADANEREHSLQTLQALNHKSNSKQALNQNFWSHLLNKA